MAYTVSGVDPAQFSHLFGLGDEDLARRGAVRRVVNPGDAFPERVELRDAPVGENVLLVNYTHLPTQNPYRSSYAIFVRENAEEAVVVRDAVPEVLGTRLISLRAFDERDFLAAADVVEGSRLEPLILDYLAGPEVAYLHAHYAKFGCFAAKIVRS